MESVFYYVVLYGFSIIGGVFSAGMSKDKSKSYLFRLFAASLIGFTATLLIKSFVFKQKEMDFDSAAGFFPVTIAISMIGWHLARIVDALGQKAEDNPEKLVEVVFRRGNPPEKNGPK